MNSKRLNVNLEDSDEKKNLFSELRYKIWEWWHFTFLKTWPFSGIMGIKYNLENGIRNHIRWFKTIWNDRDWDGSYILTILIKKIELQRETLINNNIVHPDELKAMDEEMSKCLDLLRKVNDEWKNYEEPFIDQHDKKWGKRDFEFIPVEKSDNFSVEMRYINELTEEEKEQERLEYREGMEKARHQRELDLSEAMQIIARHVDEWWD